MRIPRPVALSLTMLTMMLAAVTAARGDTWTVTLDTSKLTANYAGPFGIDFQLIGDNGSTLALSNFAFGGGAAGGGPFLTGGATGSLGSTVILSSASEFFTDFNQGFTPGAVLTFTVDATNVAPPPGGTPDNFSMVLFEGYDPTNGYDPSTGLGGTPISTLDPTGADTLLAVDLNGPGASTGSTYDSTNGDVTVSASLVPEPSSAMLLATGGLALVLLGRPLVLTPRKRDVLGGA